VRCCIMLFNKAHSQPSKGGVRDRKKKNRMFLTRRSVYIKKKGIEGEYIRGAEA